MWAKSLMTSSATTAMIHKKSVAEYDCGEISLEINKMWKKIKSELLERY